MWRHMKGAKTACLQIRRKMIIFCAAADLEQDVIALLREHSKEYDDFYVCVTGCQGFESQGMVIQNDCMLVCYK